MKNFPMNKTWYPVFETNDLDAFVPEMWAQESLMILENQMVMGNLVYRDYESVLANYGDVVNTRQPGTFEAKRKTNADSVTIQNATATNVPVPLNQHFHISFLIRDGEQAKGFKNLITEYLRPAVIAMAEGIDQVLVGQAYRFRANSVGKLGTALDKTAVVDARALANTNKMPMVGRNVIVTPNGEADLLNIADFVNAEKVGDDGTALREGSIGRKFGFDFYMSQQCPSIAAGNSTTTTAVDHSGGYAAGVTTIQTTAFAPGGHPLGAYFTVAGDMTPQRITAINASQETITFSPGLKYAVSHGAAVTIYTPGAVESSGITPTALSTTAGYYTDFPGIIVTDTFTVAPKRGQLVSFGTAAYEYAAIGTPTTIALSVDKPLYGTSGALSAAIDEAAVNIGPAGDFCFGFHRNALALVVRPLPQPEPGTGAKSYVAEYNGLAVRVVITYNGEKQGHLVTVDLLAGVATLNTALGFVMYA